MIHFSSDISTDANTMVFQLQERSKGIERALALGIRAGTIHLQTVLKRDVLSGQVLNRRSGNLSRAVFTKMDTPLSGFVGIGKEAKYARYLEDGSRPHIILPKNGKYLVFTPGAGAIRSSAFVSKRSVARIIKQNRVFAKGVNHPGNPPYHFIRLALTMATPGIRQIIADRLQKTATGKAAE